MEINKTVIVASRWFLYYLTYSDDARSNTNQTSMLFSFVLNSVSDNYTDDLLYIASVSNCTA